MYSKLLDMLYPQETAKIIVQLPLTSLRTYDVTHSRFVTHFRILKNSKFCTI